MSRVTLTNPFDILGDENEDRTNVPAPKASKEQKPTAPAAKPAAKAAAAPATAKPAAAKPAAPKAAEAKAPAVAKPAEAKAAPKAAPAPRDSNQNLQEREKESRPPREKKDRAPQGDNRGKRTYDRKPGTGRPQNEVKKGGQGKGNWGGEVDAKEGVEALQEKEGKVEEKEEGEETKEEKPAVEGEKKEGEAPKEEPKAEEKEEETFTLEEYLARKKAKTLKTDALQIRTVTDEDFGAAGLVPLKRGDDEETKKEKKASKEEKAAADKKEKKETNLAAKLFTFASHQEEKRNERRGERRPYNDNRNSNSNNDRQGPRRNNNPRPRDTPKGPAAAAASTQPPVQAENFPALRPHGADAVKA